MSAPLPRLLALYCSLALAALAGNPLVALTVEPLTPAAAVAAEADAARVLAAAQLPTPGAGQKVVIYCRSGRRSVSAMEKARQGGRPDADTHFGGGILGWTGAGEPVKEGMEA